jgi:hypothetical protein
MYNPDLKQLFSKLKLTPKYRPEGARPGRDWTYAFCVFLLSVVLLIVWHGYQTYVYVNDVAVPVDENGIELDAKRLEAVASELESKQLQFSERLATPPTLSDPAL